MDKKSFVQFVAISTVITAVWFVMVGVYRSNRPDPVVPAAQAPKPAPVVRQTHAPSPQPNATAPAQPATPATSHVTNAAPVAAQTGPPTLDPPESTAKIVVGPIVLQNEHIRAEWTQKGAALRRLTLRNGYRAPYREDEQGRPTQSSLGKRPDLTLVRDFQRGLYSDVVEFVYLLSPRHDLLRTLRTADLVYELREKTADRAVFEAAFPPHVTIRKTVTLPADGYAYEVELEFVNTSGEDLAIAYRLRGPAGIERETFNSREVATVVMDGTSEKVAQLGAASVLSAVRKDRRGDLRNSSANILWAGCESKYFVALVQPAKPWIAYVDSDVVADTDMDTAREEGRWPRGSIPPKAEANRFQHARNNVVTSFQSENAPFGPSTTHAASYRFIAAPKLDKVVSQYSPEMTEIVRFGLFPSISRMLLGLLNVLYRIIPNYGVAILLLTVIVKTTLHPLTRRSQTGMQKTQKLQPMIAELRKKYGDDRQRMAQEQMALFRKYGVHPMSGCWPMLLQMPILLSLFGLLRYAVQLRHAMFIPGWIPDLSAPDTVFRLPFYMPIIGNSINVLPFLMAGVSLVSQSMMPKPADPQAQQTQKMMKFMPILFAVMLYNFASGLLLYWTASSALGILETWWIRRKLADMELKPVAEVRAAKRAAPGDEPAPGIWARLSASMDDQEKASRQIRRSKTMRRRDKDNK